MSVISIISVILFCGLSDNVGAQSDQCASSCVQNLCQQKNLDCCWCRQLFYGSQQMCACCPQGYGCCPFTVPFNGVVRAMCCPDGTTCDMTARTCINYTGVKATQSETTISHCRPLNLKLTADSDVVALYVDGNHVPQHHLPNRTNRLIADEISLSVKTRVVAVSLADFNGVSAGFLAQVSDQVIEVYAHLLITDLTWRCSKNTDDISRDWMNVDFDDSAWPAAVVHAANNGMYREMVKEISSSAKWIWTINYVDPNIDSRIYCRGRFPVFGNQCQKTVVGCGDQCSRTRNHYMSCCWCEMEHVGPNKVCSCCPSGTFCCGYQPSATNLPVCCPANSKCTADGRCITKHGMLEAVKSAGTCESATSSHLV